MKINFFISYVNALAILKRLASVQTTTDKKGYGKSALFDFERILLTAIYFLLNDHGKLFSWHVMGQSSRKNEERKATVK